MTNKLFVFVLLANIVLISANSRRESQANFIRFFEFQESFLFI